MGLFTSEEKLEIYRRLKSDHRPRGAILAHTMLASAANLRMIKEECPEIYIQTRAAYRLVERGVITTVDQFDNVAKKLIRGIV